MAQTRSKGVLERGISSDLWRRTLSQIPSCLGRLAYLSSLRIPNSGRYEHHGLALRFGESETDKTLRKTHNESFTEWLNYSMEQQKADLELYLSAQEGEKREILENWAALMPYRYYVPASVREPERMLYVSDLEILLKILRNEFGVAFPDRDA
jgi:hypothetical protein